MEHFENVESEVSHKRVISSTGLLLLGLTGVGAVGLTAICAPFVLPALRRTCLPYVPATTIQVRNVLSALEGRRKGRILDLGSGDGRLVISTAQQGFTSEGVELNSLLVLYSRFQARRLGLGGGRAKFYRRDLWKTDLTRYDNVIIFGVEEMMSELEQKMSREMPPSSCVVACRFPLPSWNPAKVIGSGIDTVWLYHVPILPHTSK